MSAANWGGRPRDWAELAEPSNRPLFETVLSELGVGEGTELLDIGCGSGYALSMAADLGAALTGIDITPELLKIARERVPGAVLVASGMDKLPFLDERFDVAVGFNAFQFADNPESAVAEAARVVSAGGLVAASTFAEPERNQSTALHLALEPLRSGAPGAGAHLPYSLSEPGGLEALLASAALEPVISGEVALVWRHADVDRAVRAVLASGGGALAIEAAGVEAARDALSAAVMPFTLPDGRVEMHNVFRFAIGRRSS
jgi:SAM-dependent methyltransferase